MKACKFEFTVTGLVISIIIISMIAGASALFLGGIEADLGVSGNNTLSNYDQSADIIEFSKDINSSIDIQQQTGILDILGAYFGAGYSAVKVSLGSIGLFNNMMNTASEDIEYFGYFKNLFIVLILVIVIMLVITVVVKWKV